MITYCAFFEASLREAPQDEAFFLTQATTYPHAESLRKNRERASSGIQSLFAFPAKAGIHSPADACTSNNREALPTTEKFVRRSNGPRLSPGRRKGDQKEFFHKL